MERRFVVNNKVLDVIIVNYNSTDASLACLKSIIGNCDGIDPGIWVWDNKSKETPDAIRKLSPKVHLIENKKNIGFAAAVNRSLKRSNAPFVMLANPDTIFNKGCLAEVLAYFDQHPDVGVIGPRILNPDGSLQESARSFPNILSGFFGRTSLLTQLFPRNRISRYNLVSGNGNGKDPMSVDWVSGACMMVRRKAIEAVGGLDERFFMYWEDADWCRRMREKGWRVMYYSGVSVCHLVGESSRTRPLRSSLNFHTSAYRLYAKYAEGSARFLKPMVFGMLAVRFCYTAAIRWMRNRGLWGGEALKGPPG